MRVQFKLAFIFLIGVAALCGVRGPAEASVAALPIGGLEASAHVAPLAIKTYHRHYPRRGRFCRAVREICRIDTDEFSPDYYRCVRRRGCPVFDGHYPEDRYPCEYRRKGYSCRYWYHECRENWRYPDDVEGCLRYHCCGYYRSY